MMGNVVKFEKKPDLIPTLICTTCNGKAFSMQNDIKDGGICLICTTCHGWFTLEEALEAVKE